MPLPDFVPDDWFEDFEAVQQRLAAEAERAQIKTQIPVFNPVLGQFGGLVTLEGMSYSFTRPLSDREQDALIAHMAREAGFDA